MREGVITDAATCREFVTPKLVEAGWRLIDARVAQSGALTARPRAHGVPRLEGTRMGSSDPSSECNPKIH